MKTTYFLGILLVATMVFGITTGISIYKIQNTPQPTLTLHSSKQYIPTATATYPPVTYKTP